MGRGKKHVSKGKPPAGNSAWRVSEGLPHQPRRRHLPLLIMSAAAWSLWLLFLAYTAFTG